MKLTKHPNGFRLERVEDGVLSIILAFILAMIFFHGEPSVVESIRVWAANHAGLDPFPEEADDAND